MVVVFLQIVSIIFLAVLGGVVWRQQPKDPIHRGFLVFTIALNLWFVTGILSNLDTEYALFLNKLVFIFPLVVVWSAMDLALKLSQQRNRLPVLVGVAVLIVSVITLFTDMVVAGIIAVNDTLGNVVRYDIERGPIYPLYLGCLIAVAVIALVSLFVRLRKARGREKDRLSIVGIGLFGCLAIGLLTAVVLPNLMSSSAPAGFSFLSGVVITISFAIAIFKYDLFDIKLVVVRSVAYGGVLLSLSGIYYALAYVMTTLFFHGDATSLLGVGPFNILLALVLAFVFQPIKQFFDQATNSIFYRENYKSEEFFAGLSVLLSSTIDLRGLLERASKEIADTLKAEEAFFFVYSNSGTNHYMAAGTNGHAKMPLHDAHLLDDYVTQNGHKVFLTHYMPQNDKVRRMLISHRVSLVMPLMEGSAVAGYLLLGEHRSSNYTKRDLAVLATVGSELVIAIQNAMSLHKVRELNATLQQRIDVATKELRSSNAQLKHLDQVKDEFMSMASHQLRTPLTSIKGYLSMVLEGDAGKISPQQERLLLEAFNSSERMVRLISDFLNVSRMQTGKFLIEKTSFDIRDIVKQEVKELELLASTHSLKLRLNVGKEPLMIHADEDKVRQVMMNFIDNAIYYSKDKGMIVVNLEKVKNDVAFTVVDSGIGVPEDEQSKLFTKFFRAQNARKQRPDGTGVGLYLARRVIMAHNGIIIFSSKEGKGSTFGFRLPLETVPQATATAK